MIDVFGTQAYWSSVLLLATPLMFASVACVLSSRAGVLFVAVEGVMLITAFSAIAGAIWTGSAWLGVVIAVGTGMFSSAAFGWMAMQLRMGDVVAGLVVVIGAIGLTGFLLKEWFPLAAVLPSDMGLNPIWRQTGWGGGDIVFHQEPLFYVAIICAIGTRMFFRTRWGLRARVSGESIPVAVTLGIDLVRVRLGVLVASGAITGLGGAVLAVSVTGSFDVNMVNGRGFIALACVMLGAWRPLGALVAAFVFAAADAYQFQAQSESIGDWIGIFPYALTIAAVAILGGRREGPAEEGKGLPTT